MLIEKIAQIFLSANTKSVSCHSTAFQISQTSPRGYILEQSAINCRSDTDLQINVEEPLQRNKMISPPT
jgi:hypothetical protein